MAKLSLITGKRSDDHHFHFNLNALFKDDPLFNSSGAEKSHIISKDLKSKSSFKFDSDESIEQKSQLVA